MITKIPAKSTIITQFKRLPIKLFVIPPSSSPSQACLCSYSDFCSRFSFPYPPLRTRSSLPPSLPPCPIFLQLFHFISFPAGADINSLSPEASLTVGTDNNVFRGAKESGGTEQQRRERIFFQAFLRAEQSGDQTDDLPVSQIEHSISTS